jgi:hypothetical protein
MLQDRTDKNYELIEEEKPLEYYSHAIKPRC